MSTRSRDFEFLSTAYRLFGTEDDVHFDNANMSHRSQRKKERKKERQEPRKEEATSRRRKEEILRLGTHNPNEAINVVK